jgi:hypothetical protein
MAIIFLIIGVMVTVWAMDLMREHDQNGDGSKGVVDHIVKGIDKIFK